MKDYTVFHVGGIFFTLLILFSSCKYEEGPVISFTSKEKRVEREWIMTDQWVNGVKTDAPSRNYIQRYEEFGEFRAQNYDNQGNLLVYEEGGWEFENKAEILHMSKTRSYTTSQGTPQKETQTHIATILKLTKKELWYEYLDTRGNTIKEYYKAL